MKFWYNQSKTDNFFKNDLTMTWQWLWNRPKISDCDLTMTNLVKIMTTIWLLCDWLPSSVFDPITSIDNANY